VFWCITVYSDTSKIFRTSKLLDRRLGFRIELTSTYHSQEYVYRRTVAVQSSSDMCSRFRVLRILVVGLRDAVRRRAQELVGLEQASEYRFQSYMGCLSCLLLVSLFSLNDSLFQLPTRR
jgi:hypothetical protein